MTPGLLVFAAAKPRISTRECALCNLLHPPTPSCLRSQVTSYPGMDDQLHRLSDALAARYGIEHALGFGGMATVYLAHDIKHDRKVAVKVLRPELAAVLGGERFLNEITVTANLQHPNILPLFDSGEADSFLYYVMPYVEGGSLRNLIERKKQLAIAHALELVSQVSMALDYAHRQGVIHRDIKPENILLHENQPLIADFGIALAVSAAGGERLTETGLSLGTPQYMSPEQASGDRQLDPASDVYSLGCVLYEMLAGDPPHLGSTAQAIIAKIMTEKPSSISLLRDTVPPHIENALNRALAKAPADRFDSAAAFATALSTPADDVESGRKSIVVMPFADMSPDSDNEYFSDGLTEEIIADLSKLRALRVISRTSAMHLKGTTKDIKTIARELNCRYVLEGSVRKAGDRLRITAQLIDAESDAHVWAEKYNGVLKDVFDVQEQVSRSIADALAVELSPEEKRRIAERPIPNMVAYDHYLRARQNLSQFTAVGTDDAIVHLQKGLGIVGENALLYRGMGYAHFQYVNAQIDVSQDHLAKTEQYASKIAALDPSSIDIPFLQGLVATQRGQLHEAVRKLCARTRAIPPTLMSGFG